MPINDLVGYSPNKSLYRYSGVFVLLVIFSDIVALKIEEFSKSFSKVVNTNESTETLPTFEISVIPNPKIPFNKPFISVPVNNLSSAN